MATVPPFTIDDRTRPFETKQKTATLFDVDIEVESPPRSENFVAYDLTGKTVHFNLSRYDKGTKIFINEIAQQPMSLRDPDPTKGKVRYGALESELDLPSGHHLVQLDILDALGHVIDRFPRGDAYLLCIIGVTLGL